MTWDYTKKAHEKQAKNDTRWRLERFINYGTPHTTLSRRELKKYLPSLRISDDSKAFLSLLVWNKKKF